MKSFSSCCKAEWRYPVYPNEDNTGLVICRKCEKWCHILKVKRACECDKIEGQACSNCGKTLSGKEVTVTLDGKSYTAVIK